MCVQENIVFIIHVSVCTDGIFNQNDTQGIEQSNLSIVANEGLTLAQVSVIVCSFFSFLGQMFLKMY